MALEKPPRAAKTNLAGILSYRPDPDQISGYHTVMNNKESWLTIAKKNQVPVEKLIGCNFPGAVVKDKIVPEIVNWYLGNHNAFKCPETSDKKNRRFRGGEKIAIPLLGRMEIGDPIFIAPKPPTDLDNSLNDYADVIPGQKFSHEFRIPPKGAKPDVFIAGYFSYIFKIAIEGELAPKGTGSLQAKAQYKKDAIKFAIEDKFDKDFKGSLSAKFDGKYIQNVQKALKSGDKAQIVAAFLAPFEATLKEKYKLGFINISPEVGLEGSMTPIGAKLNFDTVGPLSIDGLNIEAKLNVKVSMNVGLSPAGWKAVIEKIGPEAVKQALRAAGAELALVWEYLVVEGIVAGAGILAAAVAGALALTALMAWVVKSAGDKGELLGLSTWYAAGYIARVFNYPRPNDSITGDTKMRDELVILGEKDAVADGRRVLQELNRPEATASDDIVLLAYSQILVEIEKGNDSEARRKLRNTLNQKAKKIVGLD